jgi:superfamily II DNA or RNA helicase
MALRTYGTISYLPEEKLWKLDQLQPHVSIMLKNIFSGLAKYAVSPHYFANTYEKCTELLWFTQRYPMNISDTDRLLLETNASVHAAIINRTEELFLPNYIPANVKLNDGEAARNYQLLANDFHKLHNRFLLGDDLGLGKTVSGILTLTHKENLPAAVVVQAHLPNQWKKMVEKFTNLRVHIVKTRKAYSLPPADVYIFKYTSLTGWVPLFETGYFKSCIFDEIQELRHATSDKYGASKALSMHTQRCLGMSATPIYNYGNEIFNVMDLIKPGCLGKEEDFTREWCTMNEKKVVRDPKALGTYLRDNHLMLRRTRADVGRELPPINRIVENVEYDEAVALSSEMLARQLAIKVTTGNFMERGQAAREFDAQMRHTTGVSKAKYVAAYVRMLLDNGEPVVLAGWHRQVYEIWLKELADFNPVLYTGSENASQKKKSQEAFESGETNLFIISLRSGIGLDGLQHRSNLVVIGELDWSPKVHEQLIARVDRDGQKQQVTAIFLVSDYGSDPVIIDVLGLKSSQSHGIVDPDAALTSVVSEDSRIKKMAEAFLNKNKIA